MRWLAILAGRVRRGRGGRAARPSAGPGTRRAGAAASRPPSPGSPPMWSHRRTRALDRAGGGGPPAVGPGPAVRHDRQRPPGRRGAHPGRAPVGDRRPVGAVQPGGPTTTPGAAFPGPMDARRSDTPSAVQPAAGLSVQQVALHPVDGQPGGRPRSCVRSEAAVRRGVPPRPVGVPPGRSGVEPRGLAAAPDGPHGWPAMGVLGTAAAGADRPAAWPRSSWWRSTAASPPPSGSSSASSGLPLDGTPDGHRWHGLRRGPVQQLRPPVDGGGGARLRADPGASGW